MEEKYLDLVCEVADIIQIGSRNMQNYPLITACAKTMKPIVDKLITLAKKGSLHARRQAF